MLRGLVAVLATAAGMLVAAPGAAVACSCVADGARHHLTGADAVVWAHVDDVRQPGLGGGTAHYLLTVDRVYKGEVTRHALVDSEGSGAGCGLEGIEADRRYVFFLQGDGSSWSAGLCGGTGTPRAQVERVVSTAGSPGAVPPLAVGTEPSPGGPTDLPMSSYSYAGLGAGLLVSGAAALTWLRRRSRAT